MNLFFKNPLRFFFQTAADMRLAEAEKCLKDMFIQYEKKSDGTLFVPGFIILSHRNLTRLPDLSSVVVGGGFYCDNNQLTSLEGAPKFVGGDFYCNDNDITSLKGAPLSVGGNFSCINNQLASLEDAPKYFSKLYSDLGDFNFWDDMPEDLRSPLKTKDKLEQQPAQTVSILLEKNMKVRRPIRLRICEKPQL